MKKEEKPPKKRSRFKFIKYQDVDNYYDATNVIVTTDSMTLTELLEDFRDFLRGCGYHIEGDLVEIEEGDEVVRHEDTKEKEEAYQLPDEDEEYNAILQNTIEESEVEDDATEDTGRSEDTI